MIGQRGHLEPLKSDLASSVDHGIIGRVTVVSANAVSMIYCAKIVRIPISTVSVAAQGLSTTLSRKEIDKP
jgi:hypothetical protein